MPNTEAEESNAKELVRILTEWGEETAFIRMGDPNTREPDALINYNKEERGVEITAHFDEPATESGRTSALYAHLAERITEGIASAWRGVIHISLKDPLSAKSSMLALAERLLEALRPSIGTQRKIAIEVEGARLIGEPHDHFSEAQVGIQDPSRTPTPQASEAGLIQAFLKKEPKLYRTKVNWLLVVDRSDFPHDGGIDKQRVVSEAQRLLASRFERVYLLGKWTSRDSLQRII